MMTLIATASVVLYLRYSVLGTLVRCLRHIIIYNKLYIYIDEDIERLLLLLLFCVFISLE